MEKDATMNFKLSITDYRKTFTAGIISLAVVVSAFQASAESLLVYTATEADNLKKFQSAFNAEHPDIKINWIRDSTGVITAKLLAEKDNPVADVIWNIAATSVLRAAELGMLHPYSPKGVEKLDPRFVDKSANPSWTGTYAWVAAVCFNTVLAKQHNLPTPSSWADLIKPVYKGHIGMPNPASSGTGFLDVSSWIQLMGEEKAWNFMDALHKNVGFYTHSGSKTCKQAAAGEYAIGISWPHRGAKLKAKGAPIEIIIPKEGIGWEANAVAIIKGTKKLDAAKTLVDWAISSNAMKVYAKNYSVVAMPGMAVPKKDYPTQQILDGMIDNDFVWAANNRAAILKEWISRYDSKSEPKKKK